MNYNQSHKQTAEFLARVKQIERHLYENRDREITQAELIAQFDISRMASNAACNRLESEQLIVWSKRNGKRYYKWRGDDLDLLYQFMATGKVRGQVREFGL